jgi:hypothetical protein
MALTELEESSGCEVGTCTKGVDAIDQLGLPGRDGVGASSVNATKDADWANRPG